LNGRGFRPGIAHGSLKDRVSPQLQTRYNSVMSTRATGRAKFRVYILQT
jgi:hypothetical protein